METTPETNAVRTALRNKHAGIFQLDGQTCEDLECLGYDVTVLPNQDELDLRLCEVQHARLT